MSKSKASVSLAEHASIAELRGSNDRLLRQLAREKDRTALLSTAIERGVRDALSGLVIPPVSRPRRGSTRRHDAEKAIILLGDPQGGKKTPTYNSTVMAERIARYARKVKLLTDIQRSDHPVREARVYLLGDQVEGEFNFPHQPHQIDSSLFRQIKDGAEVHANFLRDLLAYFDAVHVVGVIGNHGRIGSMRQCVNPETNGDRMLYNLTETILRAEKRLTWHIPWERDERAWYAVDYPFAGHTEAVVHKHGRRFFHDGKYIGPGFLVFHGDQIPGSSSYSDGAIARHIFGWASGAVKEPFHYCVNGHHHRARSWRFNRFRGWQNGSTECTNTFAQEKLAAVGFPEQYLLFCHPTRGVSAEYLVDLSED